MSLDDNSPATRRPLTLAIDPVALVITECITVTSAMRKHARWAHSSVSAILGSGTATRLSADERRQDRDRKSSVATIDGPSGADDGLLTGRWGLRGKQGASLQDNPLLSAFARLRSDMKHCQDIHTFDAVTILHPFMQVIRSSSTTAPITSLALIAITKMLSYSVISPLNPNFAKGLQLLSSTVTHCRFEAENTTTDEVVFLRILKLTEDLVTGPSGDYLSHQSICEMMSCVLGLCCVLRATEVVRRSAEISMVSMCQVIFQRLRKLDLEHDQDKRKEAPNGELDDLEFDTKISVTEDTTQPQTPPSAADTPSSARPSTDTRNTQRHSETRVGGDEIDVRPYSLPAIRELFRFLAELLDPFKRERTDTMRIIALRIVNVTLEVAGPWIAYQPSLAAIAKDSLCKNLFELVRSENIAILHESLRVTGTLLATCRKALKLQQELYLSYVVTCLHPRVPIPDEPTIPSSLYDAIPHAPRLAKPAPGGTPSRLSTPVPVKDRQRLGMEGGSRKPDARESMVESVGALVRIPTFMVELFVNYDCQVDGADLCLDMVGLLSRNAFPDSATWSTTNVPPLCLDSLLTYIQFVADRLGDEPVADGLPDPQILRAQRARKAVIIRGVSKFNESPMAGVAFLAAQGIIQNADDPHSIAKFLRGTTRIDKRVLGDFLSKLTNLPILNAFLDHFDFSGQRVDEALRQLLMAFRLPGEAALIERIVTVFSAKYLRDSSDGQIVDSDAMYVLTYAIIMLNTDQHNPNVKGQNRMQNTDFARNLRGVNGGNDFDAQYLQDIYDSIKTREIILPEEHDNKNASEHAWKELLVKAQSATDLVQCDTNIYDADMFEATWQPVVATLNYVFMSATDDAVFHRVTAGYLQCAQIAAKYGVYDCLDRIVVSLSQISGLATETPPSTALNTEVQVSGKSVMVSKFAVDFGREQRAQMAALVLFRSIRGQESAIRQGWQYIIRIIVNLYINSLVPSFLAALSRPLELPPVPLQSPTYVTSRIEKSAETGLFSAFTSYVSSVMNDEPPEPNEQEIQATLSTIQCVNACRIDDIVSRIDKLPVTSLQSLTASIVEMLPRDASPKIAVVKPEIVAPTPIRTNGTTITPSQPQYDPAMVCLLEFVTILAMRDDETITSVGVDVARALQASIRNAERFHPIIVSRLTYYLLGLIKKSNDHDFVRAPVVLHHIASFPPELLKHCANNILKGLLECISGSGGLRSEMASSPDFWSLLHSLRALPDGAPLAFRIIEDIASGSPSTITADNYEPAVSLLDAFAVAGGEVTTDQHLREHQDIQRRKRAPQHPLPPVVEKRPARSDTVLRGVSAMHILRNLSSRVPTLISSSHLDAVTAWQTYWTPIFRILSAQCTNPSRDIRQAAFGALQRTLLSSDLASSEHREWTNVFSLVLGLLANDFRNPDVLAIDPRGMAETKIQLAQLLCKLFLHYLALLKEWDGMSRLWTDVLGVMEDCLRHKTGIPLEEELPESLKNILLVMSGDGLLVPPSSDASEDRRTDLQKQLWQQTYTRLEPLLPDLLLEVFPAVANSNSAATNTDMTMDDRTVLGDENVKIDQLQAEDDKT